jgi:hypothetical protein
MTLSRRVLFLLLSLTAIVVHSAAARAQCLLSGVQSISTSNTHLGTYTAPIPPADQTFTISVQIQYAALGLLAPVACRMGLFFMRGSTPPSMSTGGGSATLPYDLRTAATGGNTLIHTAVPDESGMIVEAWSAPLTLGSTRTLNFTFYGRMQPVDPQQGGAYQDNITLALVGQLLILIPVVSASQPHTVTADVTKTCTIGGVSNPAADSASIPIIGGNVDTTPIPKSYANVVCNSPSSVQLTSLGGALTGPVSPGSAFQNHIDYSAQALFSGATAQINTETNPSATGAEAGTPSTATGNMPQGTLSLSIVPHANTLPLVRGNYADTLRISITPN